MGAVTVRVVLPEPVVIGWLMEAVRPDDGEAERLIELLKPLTEAMVIVDAAEAPASNLRDNGLAETVKSATVMLTATEWIREPLVAVTVAV